MPEDVFYYQRALLTPFHVYTIAELPWKPDSQHTLMLLFGFIEPKSMTQVAR